MPQSFALVAPDIVVKRDDGRLSTHHPVLLSRSLGRR
jgi:hypothetical protein